MGRPLFTAQHYRAISTILATVRMLTKTDEWCNAVNALAALFAADNPRFDEERFRSECNREVTL